MNWTEKSDGWLGSKKCAVPSFHIDIYSTFIFVPQDRIYFFSFELYTYLPFFHLSQLYTSFS